MIFHKILIVVISLSLVACSEDNAEVKTVAKSEKARYINKSGPLFYSLITNLKNKGSDKILRGFEIGDHKDSIYLQEKGEREHEGVTYHSYKQVLEDQNHFIYCDYKFDKKGYLTFAEVNIYGNNDSITKNIFDDLQNHYTTLYGKGFIGFDHWITWNSVTKKSKRFVVGIKYVPTFMSGAESLETALSKVMVKTEEIFQ